MLLFCDFLSQQRGNICVTFIFLEARPCSWRKQIVGSKELYRGSLGALSVRFHLQALIQLCWVCKSANAEGIVQSRTLGFHMLQHFVLFISNVFI